MIELIRKHFMDVIYVACIIFGLIGAILLTTMWTNNIMDGITQDQQVEYTEYMVVYDNCLNKEFENQSLACMQYNEIEPYFMYDRSLFSQSVNDTLAEEWADERWSNNGLYVVAVIVGIVGGIIIAAFVEWIYDEMCEWNDNRVTRKIFCDSCGEAAK